MYIDLALSIPRIVLHLRLGLARASREDGGRRGSNGNHGRGFVVGGNFGFQEGIGDFGNVFFNVNGENFKILKVLMGSSVMGFEAMLTKDLKDSKAYLM
jgi:hypothetical protein